jgi:hypothetical protein
MDDELDFIQFAEMNAFILFTYLFISFFFSFSIKSIDQSETILMLYFLGLIILSCLHLHARYNMSSKSLAIS